MWTIYELCHSSVNIFFSNFAFAVVGLNRVGTKSAVNVNVMEGVFSFQVTLIEFLDLPKTRTRDFFTSTVELKSSSVFLLKCSHPHQTS